MIAWRSWGSFGAALVASIYLAWAAGAARAQEAAAPAAGDKRPAAVDIAPKTRDNVQLAATFYPAKKPGKEVVPVILLHGLKGSRADMQALAMKLQDAGHAALAIDLRGHGSSTKQALPNGKERTIDPGHLTKTDIANMVNYDVEAGKKYLMERNNAGDLKIDKLCIA
jgi:pimeloyl-ACP methyl ester carboxylesterase